MFLYTLGQPMPLVLPLPSALNVSYVLVLAVAAGCTVPQAAVAAVTECTQVLEFSLASLLLEPGTYTLQLFAQNSPTNTDPALATPLPFPPLQVRVASPAC